MNSTLPLRLRAANLANHIQAGMPRSNGIDTVPADQKEDVLVLLDLLLEKPKVLNVQEARMRCTPGAVRLLEQADLNPWDLIRVHLTGDWGTCDPEDAAANDDAVKTGARVLGVYELNVGKLWVISDQVVTDDEDEDLEGHTFRAGERYALTVLLPEEY